MNKNVTLILLLLSFLMNLFLSAVIVVLLVIRPTQFTQSINSYQECVDAGYPILESYPEQCMTPDGRNFVNDVINFPEPEPPIDGGQSEPGYPGDDFPICRDLCGNGTCEEIVCMGTGCACAESPDSCPQDCK